MFSHSLGREWPELERPGVVTANLTCRLSDTIHPVTRPWSWLLWTMHQPTEYSFPIRKIGFPAFRTLINREFQHVNIPRLKGGIDGLVVVKSRFR